jgi:hypothetical protein
MWICGEQVARTGESAGSGGARLRTGSAGERGRGLERVQASFNVARIDICHQESCWRIMARFFWNHALWATSIAVEPL